MVSCPAYPDVSWMKRYKVILVTGCHRAGTRFITRVLATELNRRFVGEEMVGNVEVPKVQKVMGEEPCVIHGPAFFRDLNALDGDNVLFVFVHRPANEIDKSNRMSGVGVCKYRPEEREEKWRNMKLQNKADINYHDFENHPFWVDQAARDKLRENLPPNINSRKELIHETNWKWVKRAT